MAHYALLNKNLIEAIIIADEEFLPHVKPQYELVLDISDITPFPHVGDSYYPDTKSFIKNSIVFNEIPADLDVTTLSGTEPGFDSMQLSKYTANCKDGVVTIGCKQYTALGLLDALHKVLVNKQQTTSHFTVLDEGPTHGKFGITWNDANLLYNALMKVKF